jgi:hypothetical protein
MLEKLHRRPYIWRGSSNLMGPGVVMTGESVVSALQSLKEERARLDRAILALEMLIAQGRRRRGRPRKHPPGTSAAELGASAASPSWSALETQVPGGARRRKNAPRGLLREKIREVLRKARGPVAPVDLRDAILASSYPTKSPKTLYSAVFAAAKADPRVKKTASGFELR